MGEQSREGRPENPKGRLSDRGTFGPLCACVEGFAVIHPNSQVNSPLSKDSWWLLGFLVEGV